MITKVYMTADYLQDVWGLRLDITRKHPNSWAARVGLVADDRSSVTKRVVAAREFLRKQPGYDRYGTWYIRVAFPDGEFDRWNPPYRAVHAAPPDTPNYATFLSKHEALDAAKALYDWLDSTGPVDMILEYLAERR